MALPQRRGSQSGAVTMNTQQILIFLAVGLLAGFIASVVLGGDGLLRYLIIGVLGSFVGGYLFSALRIQLPVKSVLLSQIITATAGAILVVIAARIIA